MKTRRTILLAVMVIAILGIFICAQSLFAQTTTLYWGSTGSEVTTLQSKLKAWGYYTGSVDGVFGAGTAKAVRDFQAKNGLPVDGVVGSKTWAALGFPAPAGTSSNYQPSRGVSGREDVTLLARLVQGEAGSEPYLGKVAVAAVILNRVASDKFPNTVAGVVYQPNAFESITNGVANGAPSQDSIRAAEDAMNGWDPSQSALFFWNPSKPVSAWIWSRQIITQIGAHVFAR